MATIYEALRRKLGREPTAAELKADVERIKREAYEEVARKGKLPHQRRRKNPINRAFSGGGRLPMSAKERAELIKVFKERADVSLQRARDARRAGHLRGLYSAHYFQQDARHWSREAMRLKRGDRLAHLEREY